MSRQTRKRRECGCNSCVATANGGGMKDLRVAICLYGQPREAKGGFETFTKLMNQEYHSNITFDIFFHSWIMHENPGEKISYTPSPYRGLKKEQTEVDSNILEQLVSMYKPVSFGASIPITFRKEIYENTLLYNNTNEYGQQNANNIMSQTYSRQKVRDTLAAYIKATGAHYDFVLGSRFDYMNDIAINFNTLEPANLHTASYRRPRHSIPDGLIICNQAMFLKVFNIFNNFHNIVNNKELADNFVKTSKKELFIFHPEEILHINYIYYFKNNNLIEYHDEIPNFHK